MNQRISRAEIISIFNIEISFFDELTAVGLLQIEKDQGEIYMDIDHLTRLERLTNLYYDLEINIPGLEAIEHLLEKVKDLQNENQQLKLINSAHIHFNQ